MLVYLYSIKDSMGVTNGLVFVEHEWEVTCRLADFYRSTEEDLLKHNGLTFKQVNNLEELHKLSKRDDVISFM